MFDEVLSSFWKCLLERELVLSLSRILSVIFMEIHIFRSKLASPISL